jgi:hypothetical protein
LLLAADGRAATVKPEAARGFFGFYNSVKILINRQRMLSKSFI